MFGSIGAPELIAIFVLALVLFGPKKLPELGRALGRTFSEFRRASNEFRTSLERELSEAERPSEVLTPSEESVAREPGQTSLSEDGTKGGTGAR